MSPWAPTKLPLTAPYLPLLLPSILHSALCGEWIPELTRPRSKRWSLWDFGYEYLYQFCRAGFSYSRIAYEVEARNAAGRIANLLTNGRSFFLYWRARALYGKLGYPVEVNYRDVSRDVRELRFQKGKVQINHTKNPDCHRYKAGPAAWSKWECRAF